MSSKLLRPELRTCRDCSEQFTTSWAVRCCEPCRASRKTYPSCDVCGSRTTHRLTTLCRTCRGLQRPRLRPMSGLELAWVAGLLEGEGSFCANRKRLFIHVTMTDRDVLENLAAITGVGSIYELVRRRSHHTQAYRWQIGWAEIASALAAQVYPLLSERRKGQAARLLPNAFTVPSAASMSYEEKWAWFSGLFEGEGYIGLPSHRRILEVESTDRDVIDRLRAISGVGSIYNVSGRADHWRRSWRWSVTGESRVVEICRLMFPHLGARRTSAVLALPEFQLSARD